MVEMLIGIVGILVGIVGMRLGLVGLLFGMEMCVMKFSAAHISTSIL
jgi:hypothetical protein